MSFLAFFLRESVPLQSTSAPLCQVWAHQPSVAPPKHSTGSPGPLDLDTLQILLSASTHLDTK